MDTTITATLPPTAGASSAAGSIPAGMLETPKQIQDRFLKLLIAQLKNQDPLSPMDNAEMTAQMAQISTVQGLSALNDTVRQLVGLQISQAAGLIGREVLTGGNTLYLSAGSARGALSLERPADAVSVEVLDAAGTAIDRVDLGPQPAGVVPFAWDGTDASGIQRTDGAYTFRATASVGGVPLPAQTLSAGRVQSVGINNNSPSLMLDGGRETGLSDLRLIL